MTRQDYYNLLVQSATNGTFPSIALQTCRQNKCLYRGPNGKKCAIGILISDEEYDGDMENDHLLDVIPKIKNKPDLTIDEFGEVQDCHDDVASNRDTHGWSHVGFKPVWSSEKFIQKLNKLECFQNVDKVNAVLRSQ